MRTLPIIALVFITLFSNAQDLETEPFVSGLNRPVNLKHAGDDRLFVVEQDGIIKIINSDGTINTTPFLDINGRVGSEESEQGLLGLAFHPDYATNGYFFVNYTNLSENTVVSRFSRSSSNPSVADPNSELIILTFSQPFENHNAGELQFGPDGYLYIATGDGGSGGDPQNNSQRLVNLLGKLLRIDVNNSTVANPYAIPSDNPFVSNSAAMDEIWAYGLRNPWKFSFDRTNNDLWIADVGQNAREEINLTTSSENTGGINYGWRCYEGNNTYNTGGCPNSNTLDFPVAEYVHSGGRCSITGGYRYRGTEHPGLAGLYFFADVCTQEIGYLKFENGNWNSTFENFSGSVVAFGEDVNGELYACTLGGTISKLIDNNTLSVGGAEQSMISIYPNPSKNELYIDFTSYESIAIDKISVYDMHGKVITSVDRTSEDIQKINTTNFTNGIYLLQMNTSNGNTYIYKFVKN